MSRFTSGKWIQPYKISNFITSPRKKSYKGWLNSPVEDDNGEWQSRTGEFISHKRFICKFHKDLERMVADGGYKIDNMKEFKREVAIFIYRLSRESKHASR